MKIEFKKIRYKNFMSYGNKFTEFNFSNGIDIVTGKNGIGKSAMLSDPLLYVLFGKPYRKVKLGTLVNDINNKDLLVELTFTINKNEFLVRRGMKPSVFEIYKNDKLINQECTTKEYQAILEERILCVNEQTFRQLIVLGANITSTKPFLELNQNEKNDVFNAVIDTNIFNTLRDELKYKFNSVTTTKTDLDYRLSFLDGLYAKQLSNSERMSREVKEFKKLNDEHIKTLKKEYKENQNTLEKLSAAVEKYCNIDDDIKKKTKETLSIAEDYKRLKKIKDDLNYKLKMIQGVKSTHSICIGCEKLKDIVNIDVEDEDEYLRKLTTNDKEIESIKQRLEEKLKQKEELEERANKLKTLKNRIDIILNKQKSLEDEIERIKNTKPVTIDKDALRHTKEQMEDITKELKDVNKEHTALSNLIRHITDKNIRAAILNKQLPLLNKFINQYIEKFSTTDFNMIINGELKEKIITNRGVQKEFNQLSNGQKFRLTFSLIFAFLKFIESKNGVAVNLLLCDEVLDTSLDAEGREDLLNILKYDFGADKDIIIISHNNEIKEKEEMFDRTISIKKDKFSTMEISK